MTKTGTALFRRYARFGFDKRECDEFDMPRVILGVVGDREKAREMLAVYDALRYLEAVGEGEAVAAVREIYFAEPWKLISKNEISTRVRRFAYRHSLDDRTVYRRLRRAKMTAEALCGGKGNL